jgi:hypothetical protein
VIQGSRKKELTPGRLHDQVGRRRKSWPSSEKAKSWFAWRFFDCGHVNISEATYQLVRHEFHCVYRGEITVKNLGDLKMYWVEGRI